MEHTPGPWKWDCDPCNREMDFRDQNAPWLIGENGDPVLVGDVYVEKRANAAILEAASELYDLAEVVANHLYDKQDMSRCKDAARSLITKIQLKRGN